MQSSILKLSLPLNTASARWTQTELLNKKVWPLRWLETVSQVQNSTSHKKLPYKHKLRCNSCLIALFLILFLLIFIFLFLGPTLLGSWCVYFWFLWATLSVSGYRLQSQNKKMTEFCIKSLIEFQVASYADERKNHLIKFNIRIMNSEIIPKRKSSVNLRKFEMLYLFVADFVLGRQCLKFWSVWANFPSFPKFLCNISNSIAWKLCLHLSSLLVTEKEECWSVNISHHQSGTLIYIQCLIRNSK